MHQAAAGEQEDVEQRVRAVRGKQTVHVSEPALLPGLTP